MLRKIVDALGHGGDLIVGAACIGVVDLVVVDIDGVHSSIRFSAAVIGHSVLGRRDRLPPRLSHLQGIF